MSFLRIAKHLSLFSALPLVVWLLVLPPADQQEVAPDQVNLALRRTVDQLLRAAGDSTSRIPAIQQTGKGVWQVRLERSFPYEPLPALLQASLDLYGIRQPYNVKVRRCFDATIDLGYHQQDFLKNNDVPCSGRAMPEGCHYLEIAFVESPRAKLQQTGNSGLLLLLLGGLAAGLWLLRRQKPISVSASGEPAWLEFGQSQLDVAGQVLVCGGVRQELTFREAKLLRLFAAHPDGLLERDLILRQVWADEGVQVSRSVDVFVSRLRKKLANDPSIAIVSVHGVGYRLETGKRA